MQEGRLAAGLGLAASAVTAVLALLPYAVLDPTAVRPYVAAAPAGPPVLVLLTLLAVVVLAAGLAGRQDPALVAGAAVVLGTFATIVGWWWALSVTPSLVGSLTDAAAFAYHRWATAVGATVLLAAAAAYARAVL